MEKKDGFTILEVIIAIAALSVISVFILQMFISSATLNSRARNVDIATTMAISEMENLKKHNSLSDYLEANGIAADGRAITTHIYYDKDWNTINADAAANAVYYMQIELNTDSAVLPAVEDVPCGALYDVKVAVFGMSSGESGKTSLASLQTNKYFPAAFDKGGQP